VTLQRGISSDENETTKHKEVVDDEVYDLVEQELMRRISTENETLFEKEANQMFIRVVTLRRYLKIARYFLVYLIRNFNSSSSSS